MVPLCETRARITSGSSDITRAPCDNNSSDSCEVSRKIATDMGRASTTLAPYIRRALVYDPPSETLTEVFAENGS